MKALSEASTRSGGSAPKSRRHPGAAAARGAPLRFPRVPAALGRDGAITAGDLELVGVDLLEGGVAVVPVSGPLEHHPTWCWDSYDDIGARVALALAADEVRALVLRIDSPGGVVAGSFELHRTIRRLRARHGKPVLAYADELAASAAYALACAADEIWLPDTGTVGSVGVILALLDTTEANRKAGVRVELVTSGQRKADTQPDRKLTSPIVRRAQDRVDYFAGIFVDLVAKARGLKRRDVSALEAGVYSGAAALEVGLADGVAGWSAFLARARDLAS